LAANRIDTRRAQIIIYGLQVASQNNRQRSSDRKLPTVREAHEHQDGSLVAPPQQQPDPEDFPEKEIPSLGRILLKEADALKAQRVDEREAAEQPADVSRVPGTVNLQAAAEIPPARSCHHPFGRKCRVRLHGISRVPQAAGMGSYECPHNRIPAIPLILGFEERPPICKEG